MAKASLEQFDGGDFAEYLERLEFYFAANDIGVVSANATSAEKARVEKKMTAHLVSHLSKSAFTTLKSLCLPNSPSSKKYAEIATLLTDHYKEKSTTTTATFKFRQCIQRREETVTEFSHRLKRAAVPCEFATHLDRAMKDQFVAGLFSVEIKKKILTSADTDTSTFGKVLKIAENEFVASAQAQELAPSSLPAYRPDVHHVKSSGNTARRTKPRHHDSPAGIRRCYRCGSIAHLANKCSHLSTECRFCHKLGHLEQVCQLKSRRGGKQNVHHIDDSPSDTSDTGEIDSVPLFLIRESSQHVPPYRVNVHVNDVNTPINMEFDTGSGVSILSKHDFERIGGVVSDLSKPSVRLRVFTDIPISCLGEKHMKVSLNGQTHSVLLRVVDGACPSLLGRDIMNLFTLPWKDIFSVKSQIDEALEVAQTREEIISQFPELFDSSTLGKLNTTKVTLRVDNSKPVFMKARSVPFSITEKYEAALSKLEKAGVIHKVEHSQWATPTVPVAKPDGNIRICADYSRTINANSEEEKYPLPTIDEIRAKLAGGQKFTKIDLSQAYHQLELDESSRVYTTINTHKGLYEYVRLPFGIHSAVAIFQRTMETVLADTPGCVVYIDDILVTGADEAEHRRNLARVLKRLQEVGMKLKAEKFHFMLDNIVYLGHTLSAAGIAPCPDKIKAISNAQSPTALNELQSFIGSANYLRKFIPNFASIMSPLYALLKKDTVWKWSDVEQHAFAEIKRALCSTEVLAYYSNAKSLKVQVDASGVGLGAVLLQEESPGEFRPIAYASRVLAHAEKNYSNIERESLSLVFGVSTFRQYLLGRKFTLETDHQPLVKLFGCTEGVPHLVSSCLKKWKMNLSAYEYTVQHIPGKNNVLADFMSRKPVPGSPSTEELVDVQVLFVDNEIVNAASVVAETKRDPVLRKVLQYTRNGWPESIADQTFQPYFVKRWELSVVEDILLWNERVVIPDSLRIMLLNDLHFEHAGSVRMKRLARRYLWWPRLDKEIEETVAQCTECQAHARMPAKDYGNWSWPTGPWQRLHIDYAGPFMGKMFLVMVDAYSRFVDVIPMQHATSASTIAALRRNFALFGLPHHIVSDNGTQFTSEEFQQFLQRNGIRHTCSAPGHPATNGLAERYVGFFKSKMKTMGPQGDLNAALQRFLMSQRTTPLANGKSPAELLMNRQPKTRFDNLKLDTKPAVDAFERNLGRTPEFQPGAAVFALNFGTYGAKWVLGTILSVVSPMTYQVQVQDAVWKRHRNQLRERSVPLSDLVREDVSEDVPVMHPALQHSVPDSYNSPQSAPTTVVSPTPSTSSSDVQPATPVSAESTSVISVPSDESSSSTTMPKPTSSNHGNDTARPVSHKRSRLPRNAGKPERYK